MKLSVMKLYITVGVIAAVFALLFSACESEYIDTYVPEAELLSLRVVVDSGEVVMAGARIPLPVDDRLWDDEDFDLFGEADYKTISYKYPRDVIDARFRPSVSRGAKVKWGLANQTDRPGDFYDTRVPATFEHGDFVYFIVTSEDGKITNYYRFATYVSSPVRELSSMTVAGREVDVSSSAVAPSDTWNGGTLDIGELYITRIESADAEIVAVPFADTALLRYAVTPYAPVASRQPPVFGDIKTLSFGDGNLLYIEVTAENTDKNIYAFRVFVGRIATIGKLTFKAGDKGDFEALGKGTAKNDWRDHTGAGSFESPHQPTAGFGFQIELDDPAGHWEYAEPGNLTNSQPAWIRPSDNDAIPVRLFQHNQYLLVKVVPENPQGTAPDYFYKVKVSLLAAEFKVQPKSHAYRVNESAAPLEFELDRTFPAGTNVTYQWYEANSWYGGYGFDSVGRIGGKGAILADVNFGKNDRGILESNGTMHHFDTDALLNASTISGIKFNVSAWHVEQLDEKNNVSLHNGGNQYYRLPTPGKPIPNATQPTYTPPTTYEPFLGGFSTEIHYYWVEVTAGALKAVSARAVIVTEWGERWNLGHPEPYEDPEPNWQEKNDEIANKQHYIIDLYAYQTKDDPNSFGLQEPPRNVRPFNKGNHGDEYYIPVNFPEGFDIYDYSVFTAQALFYLADGRPWIQNWTQGDIGFGKDEIGEDGNPTGKQEEIVLWYNLTNDNATRGLQASGNSPAGGGLKETPQYIVVKPAGTKPINQLPPFNADGTPANNNNAQGWFTPYIELCEVRFEGPAREKPVEE
jgi:hypothetical protein